MRVIALTSKTRMDTMPYAQRRREELLIRFRASGMWVLALAGAVFHCGRFIRSNVGLSETIG
jgi:hypothetical protein